MSEIALITIIVVLAWGIISRRIAEQELSHAARENAWARAARVRQQREEDGSWSTGT